MPSLSASRRIESVPSSSSSSRATSTISRARELRALEAIGCPEAVADRTVDADVDRPRKRADEVAERQDAGDGDRRQCEREPVAMQDVVERNRAGVQLPVREAAA